MIGEPVARVATFQFLGLELQSEQDSTRAVANELALAVFDERPPWIGSQWTTKFKVGYVPTPRSKPRSSTTTNPTRARVVSEMAKPKPGEIFSTGFTFEPPTGGDRSTFIHTTWGRGFGFVMHAHDIGDHAVDDPELGAWLLRTVARVLELAPPCRPAAAWFGAYPTHPYCYGSPDPDRLPGYGWLVTLPSRLVDLLGGQRALERCPAELRATVTPPDGDPVAVLVLTATARNANDARLQAWRRFLAPVLADNRLIERSEMFARALASHPWQYDVPPMVLHDDWPKKPG